LGVLILSFCARSHLNMVKALSLVQSERTCIFTCSPIIITGNTQREVQMEDLLPLTADRRMVATFSIANIFS